MTRFFQFFQLSIQCLQFSKQKARKALIKKKKKKQGPKTSYYIVGLQHL